VVWLSKVESYIIVVKVQLVDAEPLVPVVQHQVQMLLLRVLGFRAIDVAVRRVEKRTVLHKGRDRPMSR
jgi:hypothetical protein